MSFVTLTVAHLNCPTRGFCAAIKYSYSLYWMELFSSKSIHCQKFALRKSSEKEPKHEKRVKKIKLQKSIQKIAVPYWDKSMCG